MPVVEVDAGQLSYQVSGTGDLVVLVMGTGSPGRVWNLYQVPALVAAGYRVAAIDNRGVVDGGSEPFTIDDLVRDTAHLVEHLGGGPARLVGTSLGARVVQELTLSRPDLVAAAVVMAAHGRLDDVALALSRGERDLYDAGIVLPGRYHAAVTAIQNLSPSTLRDRVRARDWLDLFECTGGAIAPGVRLQKDLAEFEDRCEAYRSIRRPVLVIGFADDRMIPTHLSREVAEAIPGARYVEVPETGHFGYLERPDDVNDEILRFFEATNR